MKRKIFFWLEKLRITPAERKAVSLLMLCLMVTVVANTLIKPSSPFEDSDYADLEQAFRQRTAMLEKKEQALLARYKPTDLELKEAAVDTISQDSLSAKNTSNSARTGKYGKININTADAKTLQALPGIGPAYSQRIVEYRQEKGAFVTYEELLKIKGIGKKRLEKLLPFIQLRDSTENK